LDKEKKLDEKKIEYVQSEYDIAKKTQDVLEDVIKSDDLTITRSSNILRKQVAIWKKDRININIPSLQLKSYFHESLIIKNIKDLVPKITIQEYVIPTSIGLFQEKYRSVAVIGTKGTEPSQFQCPYGIAVNNDGQLIVADTWNHRVQILSSLGKCVRQFGSKGNASGQFNYPRGLAIDPKSENIIVADCDNNRIQIFDKQGEFIHMITSSKERSLDQPVDVAIDPSGNIVVLEWGKNRVQVLKQDGSIVNMFGSPGKLDGQFCNAWGIAVDYEGNIFVSDSGNKRIQKFQPDGTFLWKQDGIAYPFGIVVDRAGKIIVGEYDNHRIIVLNADKTVSSSFGEKGRDIGRFRNITGLAINSQGHLIVCDYNNHRLQIFS